MVYTWYVWLCIYTYTHAWPLFICIHQKELGYSSWVLISSAKGFAESEVVMQIGISKAAETEGMSTPPPCMDAMFLQDLDTSKGEIQGNGNHIFLGWTTCAWRVRNTGCSSWCFWILTSGNGWNFSKKIHPSIRTIYHGWWFQRFACRICHYPKISEDEATHFWRRFFKSFSFQPPNWFKMTQFCVVLHKYHHKSTTSIHRVRSLPPRKSLENFAASAWLSSMAL